MSNILTPIGVVFRLIGHPVLVGEIVGKDRTTVIKWRLGTPGRKAGDIPSDDSKRRLLAYARANDIPLTPEHLINGAPESEIDQLVAQRQVAAE